MALTLRYAALSDVGRVRKDNQDAGLASEHVLVVADGVGGAVRGDLASSTAVQAMRRLEAPVDGDMLEAMAGAFHRAHDRIAELVEEDPELEGTSTTVTAALFDGTRLAVGHLGDSRAYLYRAGEISQLTKDHTFVQSLVDEGRITEAESRTHPHRNLILRAVDAVHETDPDLFYVELQAGDRVMLCSDGCSGALDDARLADILGTGTVDYAAVELVRAALDAGSSDNVTAVVADVVDPATAAAHDPETDAAATTGAMLVGAAAEQPRKPGPRGLFRGHRAGDTGELEPVPGAEGTGRGLPFGAGRDGSGPDHGRDEDVDPEELRYAPRPPRRLTWLKRLGIVAVLLLLLAGGLKIAYDWSQEQYYVAADGEQVSIYRGITAELPGVELSAVHEPTEIRLASLPEYRARQVRQGIEADSLTDARVIVSRLDDLAAECEQAVQEDATASPQSPDGSPTASPRRTRTSTPSPTPSPTPEPGPTVEPQAGDCEDLP